MTGAWIVARCSTCGRLNTALFASMDAAVAPTGYGRCPCAKRHVPGCRGDRCRCRMLAVPHVRVTPPQEPSQGPSV